MVDAPEDELSGDIDYEATYRPDFHDFYDLMKFRVSRILLVSSLYDAFTLEEDGLIFEQISTEYRDLALPFPPQVIRVSTGKRALKELRDGNYDLVITMARLVDMDPLDFGKKIKKIDPDIPVILLLTDAGDIQLFHTPGEHEYIDKIFFWNGDSALFLAITKFIEDQKNLVADISTERVKIILVIEDSPRFYSLFLPIIYTEVMRQTKSLITEGLNEHEKMLIKRARPKIILAETYEEGMEKINEFRENILGVITDVTYMKNGREEAEAGIQLAGEIYRTTPVLLQSSKPEFRDTADALGIPFLNKMSETMLQELREFFTDHLSFGAFVFKTPEGREIGRAKDIHEFLEILKTVPAESINYHGGANQFSNWLMARGELELARELRPKKVTDFKDEEDIRSHLLNAVTELRRRKQEGVITDFSKQNFEFEGSITRLGGGSLGGKGRGIAFLSVLLHRSNLERKIRGCRVRIPDTLIIGTDEFDHFMRENNLTDTVFEDLTDLEKKRIFLKSSINPELRSSLATYLSYNKDPIAVRSSSLLEDSQNQPFAGIYSTYILPNNCDDDYIRLELLCDAIKLVYASTFFNSARAYIQTTIHVPEEEKMGIVLQRLVGNQYRDRFYPIFSGVAQSYNYYPLTPLKREDGIVSIALGLGKIVVEGENVLSFSPEHPNLVHGLSTLEELLKNSQNHFYALNMSESRFQLIHGEDETLLTLNIQDAEDDDTLVYSASTYDSNDNRMRDGVGYPGPKIINFAGILKYNMIPLVELLKQVLKIGKKGMGGHIEIEFAGEMGEDDVPVLYVVQIRPLVTLRERKQVMIGDDELENSIIYTNHALGNGVIERIYDVVAVPPDTFDSLKTVEIAREIGKINRKLDGKPFLLIGPGRWGTQDRFLGIPVIWSQISNALCIVETSLENFSADPSHGTHFFHNLTSMGMHYFTVRHNDRNHRIDWDWILSQSSQDYGKFVRHIELDVPLSIKVDGRTGRGMIRLSVDEPVNNS